MIFLINFQKNNLPYFDLPFCQVKISCQFPSFLFRDVGVEQEFFFQLKGLEFGVRFPLLSNTDVTGPVVKRIAKTGGRKEKTWNKTKMLLSDTNSVFQVRLERIYFRTSHATLGWC